MVARKWYLSGLGILVLGGCVQETICERENWAHMNPEIIPAMNQIAKANGITFAEDAIADDSWDQLHQMGYKLPPFYVPGYTPRVPWVRFWQKEKILARSGR